MRKFSRIIVGVVVASMISLGTVFAAPIAQAAPAPINLQSGSCPYIIQYGQNSGCVTELQNLLNARGYNAGTVDGAFGPNTRNAVYNFQRAAGLTVDGLVGPLTKAALYNTGFAITTAYPLRSSGTTNDLYGYYVATNQPASRLEFTFSGNGSVYTVYGSGNLTNWGSGAFASTSDRKSWMIQNDSLGAGWRTITVTAYDSYGRASAPRFFTIVVSYASPGWTYTMKSQSPVYSSPATNAWTTGTVAANSSQSFNCYKIGSGYYGSVYGDYVWGHLTNGLGYVPDFKINIGGRTLAQVGVPQC